MLNGLLDAIGVKAGVIMAAFGGGLVRIAFFGTDTGLGVTVWAVIGGTITAIFLGPIGPSYLGWPPSGQATLAVTFLVGVFGMEILKRIGATVSQWSPAIRESKNAARD